MSSTIFAKRQFRPLAFITSIFSSQKKRSLMYWNTSSTSSLSAERFVSDATYSTGPRNADGNCRRSLRAVFSESSASWKVSSGRPVSSHCHITELVSITRSKNSLKEEKQREFHVLWSIVELMAWCAHSNKRDEKKKFFFTSLRIKVNKQTFQTEISASKHAFQRALTRVSWRLLWSLHSNTPRRHLSSPRVSYFAWKVFSSKVASSGLLRELSLYSSLFFTAWKKRRETLICFFGTASCFHQLNFRFIRELSLLGSLFTWFNVWLVDRWRVIRIFC